VGLHGGCIGPHFARANFSAWANYAGTCWQIGLMSYATAVHELHKYFSALGMNRISSQAPSGNLFGIE
jgi:hypothetical protein